METAEAIALHDQLLVSQPSDARHDRDICPICVDKASQTAAPPSRIPPGDAGPDVSDQNQSHTNTEGGTPEPMSDNASMTQEMHEALQKKAVDEATAALDTALAAKAAELDKAKSDLAEATSKNETLEADNSRLNGELDTAQVQLKAATDKASELETELATEKADRSKADVASKRVEQVKNLGLFSDDYVTEKASAWAEIDEAAWTERIDEWSKLKPPTTGKAGEGSADTASAMTGTSETLTKTDDESDTASAKPNARRAALGLS